MKCHCGLECEIVTAYKIENSFLVDGDYFKCSQHGFQGWVNTEGFEYLE